MKIPFTPAEMSANPPARFHYPLSPKQALRAAYEKDAVWQITGEEESLFTPLCVPDNIARAQVFEERPFNPEDGGGLDMFGIDWEYIPVAGGSMVRPGKPFMEDANEWYEKLVWPEPESWDWEGAAKANRHYLNSGKFICMWFFTGWYERLISFMDFEGAIMAMADEDQQDAVIDLFDKLSDLYIRIFDLAIRYMPEIDSICVHDDWGSQKETFFSPALVERIIVPAMRKVTDFLHSKGVFCELHSCGQNYKQVPNMIKAGWDRWNPQVMNDTKRIYDEYGDKLIVGVVPVMSGADAPEETQRAEAAAFAEYYCSNPAKPCIINRVSSRSLTDSFREELYKQSRIRFASEP